MEEHYLLDVQRSLVRNNPFGQHVVMGQNRNILFKLIADSGVAVTVFIVREVKRNRDNNAKELKLWFRQKGHTALVTNASARISPTFRILSPWWYFRQFLPTQEHLIIMKRTTI
jgi:hypothetical protein